jgi:hypothetical protein
MGWQNKRIRTSDFCMLNIKKNPPLSFTHFKSHLLGSSCNYL